MIDMQLSILQVTAYEACFVCATLPRQNPHFAGQDLLHIYAVNYSANFFNLHRHFTALISAGRNISNVNSSRCG
jgi:hypothetical protein